MKKVLSGILATLLLLGSITTAITASSLPSDADAANRNIAYTVYVSTEGSDETGNGSQNNAFATIEKAKEHVRTLDKSSGDIVVKIEDGVYELDETIVFDENDSGNENCTIYYEAAEGANPVVSGGKVLNSQWTEATEINWLGQGITAYKTTLVRDDKLRAIYVNGERASMTRKTRTPLRAVGSYNVTAGQADWAWVSRSNISSGNVFAADFGLSPNTRNPQNIELESGSTWVKAIVCAESLTETAEGETQVNFQMPYAAIAQNLGWNTGYSPTRSNDVVNVYEWLANPGEFYFDQAGSTLYYIPQNGEDLSTAEVVVPELETLVKVNGSTPKVDYAKYITFRGVTFAYTDWNLHEVEGSHGNATVQACTVATKFSDGNWHNDIYRAYDIPPAAIHVTTAHNIDILDCGVEMTGYLGIHYENDVFDCEITGNYIGHTGGAGIVIGHPQHVYENDTAIHQVAPQYAGPDKEKFPAGTEAVPRNIFITNNYLLENCYFFPGNSPITSFFTYNMRIEHNFIYKCSYSGISAGWGWCNFDGYHGSDSQLPGVPTTTSRNNHINNNRIEEICSILQDAGGIYTLGQQGNDDWTEYSEMSNNYINAFRTPTVANGSRMVNGFHPDEGSAYIIFDSNVVTNIIRNVYEMNDWRRKHNLIVTNGFSNTNRSETTAPDCTLEQYVNENYIWPKAGNNVVLNSGLQDEYTYMVSKDVMPDDYYELASNVRLSSGDTLNRRGLLDAEDEVWLAPLGTVAFEEGDTMTKAAGNEKTIQVPETLGEYKLYIKYANGDVSGASEFTLYVGEKKDLANVSDGRDYNVSELAPLILDLDRDNYTFTLNDESVNSGFTITTENNWELKATPIGESQVAETINFSTSVTDANKVLPRNVTISPEGLIEFDQPLNDSDKDIWLAPSGLSAFDENDPTQSKASGDSTSIRAPRAAGTYILTVVASDGSILSQSDAKVRVLNMVTPGNGLATYGTPALGGDSNDPIWNSAPSLVIEKHLVMDNGTASGIAKVMWDEDNLYVLVEVQDPVLNSDSSSAHERDSVEIFVDETNLKASTYQLGMGQYRISYENQQTFNGTGIQEGFESFARIVEGGYVIEAKIPFKTVDPAANAKIGFDVQINDANATGTRQDIVMWYDETGTSWQNGSNWGEVTLEEKSPIPTNGLDMWFTADRGLTLGDDGLSVLKWESQGTADVTMEASAATAPQLSTNENGVPALLFDGSTNSLSFEGVNFNDKSELSLVVVTHYTGPTVTNWDNVWTSGDRHAALFVTESGGWGSMFISPYHDWVSTRFGTGVQFCNIKHRRSTAIDNSSITISVKDGTTERMYVDGANVLVKEGQGATTQNIGSTMYIGKSISGGDDYFFKGTISEILIYDRALSDVEVEQINNYLNYKHLVTLDSISITEPTKTEYEIDEELDLDGLVVTAHYSDGSEAIVTGYNVSAFDSSTAGSKTITVSYQEQTATFTVNVKEAPIPVTLDSISIAAPTKTEYEIDEELDLDGLVVTAHYSDGSEAIVTGYNVSAFDSSTAGSKTITVSYQEQTATFTVNVKEAIITDPTPEPTDPTTEPTDPTTEPTDPTTEPTDPTTEPTDPTTEPTDPTTEPTDPTTKPTEPTTKPTEPTTKPTEPTTKPTEPTTKPTEPTTKPTEPTTKPTEPTTKPTEPVTKPDQIIGSDEVEVEVNNNTLVGLAAKADKEAFDEDVVITVREISNSSDEGLLAIEKARELIGNFDQIMLLDIKAMTQSGQISVQPKAGTKVTITMAIPEAMDPSRIALIHITDDGVVELLDFIIDGNNIIFEVDGFSTFAIVEQAVAEQDSEEEEEDTSSSDKTDGLAKTGENAISIWISLTILLAVAALVLFARQYYIKRKGKYN